MRRPPEKIQSERFSTAMRDALKANAAAALARRSNGYLFGLAMNVGQWLVISSVALVGIFHWGWPPAQLLVVLVAGIAVATIADFLKWLFARRRLLADYQIMLDDRQVWSMVTAMQFDRDVLADTAAAKPGVSIVIDLLIGAIGIWLLLMPLRAMGLDPANFLSGSAGLRGALIAVCVAPVASLASALVANKHPQGAQDELEGRSGGRGFFILLLACALWFLGSKPEAARSVMIFINAATLGIGILGVFGVWIMLQQREWLRRYLQTAPAGKISSR
jgi:hypothetical protein